MLARRTTPNRTSLAFQQWRAEQQSVATPQAAMVWWRINSFVPTQRFFFGHDNDIQCLNIHPNRRFVVSGQQVEIGGVPFCCVWDALPDAGVHTSHGCPQLQRLDHPKSVRSVIAAAFSTADAGGQLLVTVGADNRHSCFVWDWSKGQPLQKASDPASDVPAWYYGPQKKWKRPFYPCVDPSPP